MGEQRTIDSTQIVGLSLKNGNTCCFLLVGFNKCLVLYWRSVVLLSFTAPV